MKSHSLRIPGSLVHAHMPELAAVEPGSGTRPIAVQLVMLPGCAVDITAETPAVRVVHLRQGEQMQAVVKAALQAAVETPCFARAEACHDRTSLAHCMTGGALSSAHPSVLQRPVVHGTCGMLPGSNGAPIASSKLHAANPVATASCSFQL
jgi:hypothetical protein